MDWNTIFNGAIAVIAIVGFIISLYFSRQTLKQAKELNEKAINAQLFEKRYEVIEFFNNFIDSDVNPLYENIHLLPKHVTMMELLFKNTENFKSVLIDFALYYESNGDISILKRRIKDSDHEYEKAEILFSFYSDYKICLHDLKEELGIVELNMDIEIENILGS